MDPKTNTYVLRTRTSTSTSRRTSRGATCPSPRLRGTIATPSLCQRVDGRVSEMFWMSMSSRLKSVNKKLKTKTRLLKNVWGIIKHIWLNQHKQKLHHIICQLCFHSNICKVFLFFVICHSDITSKVLFIDKSGEKNCWNFI